MAKTETLQRNEVRGHLLDTPILTVLGINLEVLLYILLGILALVACFTNLGARAQSHDESLHALYSWKLYAGEGYEHNPMMHGPFCFTLMPYSTFCSAQMTLRRACRRRRLV